MAALLQAKPKIKRLRSIAESEESIDVADRLLEPPN